MILSGVWIRECILTLRTMVSLGFHFSPSVPKIDTWELFLGSGASGFSSDFIAEQNQCAQASMLQDCELHPSKR